jgi:hypothetical protein
LSYKHELLLVPCSAQNLPLGNWSNSNIHLHHLLFLFPQQRAPSVHVEADYARVTVSLSEPEYSTQSSFYYGTRSRFGSTLGTMFEPVEGAVKVTYQDMSVIMSFSLDQDGQWHIV